MLISNNNNNNEGNSLNYKIHRTGQFLFLDKDSNKEFNVDSDVMLSNINKEDISSTTTINNKTYKSMLIRYNDLPNTLTSKLEYTGHHYPYFKVYLRKLKR